MKVLKILIVMFVLIMSVGAVCAANTLSDDVTSDGGSDTLEMTQDDVSAVSEPKTFTDLENDISNSVGVFDMKDDYKFNNVSDNQTSGIKIFNEGLVINGNGHKIDASNQSAIFVIGANVTINNLTFTNAKSRLASVFFIGVNCTLTTSNVNFSNNTAVMGIIDVVGTYYSNNDRFVDCTSDARGVIQLSGGALNMDNAFMTSSKALDWGFIYTEYPKSDIVVTNSRFVNTTSNYSTAIRGSSKTIIKNCQFVNLYSKLSAGAVAVKGVTDFQIDNCAFVNIWSEKNGGAIIADVTANGVGNGNSSILNSNFTDCYSGFGGALMQFGGNITVNNCIFTNNSAAFDGGAIYISYVDTANILDSSFNENYVIYDGARGSFGGAVFCDESCVVFSGNEFTGNSAQHGGAVYLYDSDYYILGNMFAANTNLNGSFDDIYTVFDSDVAVLDDNNIYSGNGSCDLNNLNYATIIDVASGEIVLINNTIDVITLPSRFDLRDWGWVTPVKDQGRAGACWAFGSSGAMESAILRYLGIEMDISENNLEDISLRYSPYGVREYTEGGNAKLASAYALSWFGVFTSEYDVYDQMGKISPIIAANNSIHFQDVVFVPLRQNVTDNELLKRAILEYGALAITYCAEQEEPYLNPVTSAQYRNTTAPHDHCVCVVGWDDSYSASNFLITPPGDGAWIIKNSWGAQYGDKGYYYISYYDVNFANELPSVAFMLNNTVQYNKNYQIDIEGELLFLPNGDEYVSNFTAVEDDLIAAVGTFFNDSNVEYSLEIYVNGELKLEQSGVSPFYGFHTIKLDSYVPVKKGDEFIVYMKSNCLPVYAGSRQLYSPRSSVAMYNGTWTDVTSWGIVCILKAYTVADDTKIIDNKDISVDYNGGKYFTVKVVTDDGHAVGAGETVKFTINGKTTTVKTDSNGIAKIKITDVPKTYTIKTTYKGKTVTNKVTVKQVLTTSKVTVKKTAKSFALQAKLKINGKLVKGKQIIFKFNGKTYKAKTNSKGVAKVTLKKNVINKLKKGKTYTVKITYSKDTIKSTVKVQ